jgi:hypothetical protein
MPRGRFGMTAGTVAKVVWRGLPAGVLNLRTPLAVRILGRGGTHVEPKGIGVCSLAFEEAANESGKRSQAS